MLLLIASMLCAAQPGVAIGVGSRASSLRISPVGKANPNALPPDAQTVMLTDVISPHLMQRSFNESAQFVLDETLGEAVTIEKRVPDEVTKKLGDEEDVTLYGRVRVGKKWLHEALLEAGWAWVLPSARKDAALVKLEDEARKARRGLWADGDPLEPWLWRELTLLGDVEGKVVHSGWDCPHVKETQCAQCRGGRFYGLTEAKAAGFAPHDVCMTTEVLRIAADSGSAGLARRLPPTARRACTRATDCALVPTTPCSCPGCGESWREAARKDVVTRMKGNYARATCGGVGCPACAGRELGTRAVCVEKQCTVAADPH